MCIWPHQVSVAAHEIFIALCRIFLRCTGSLVILQRLSCSEAALKHLVILQRLSCPSSTPWTQGSSWYCFKSVVTLPSGKVALMGWVRNRCPPPRAVAVWHFFLEGEQFLWLTRGFLILFRPYTGSQWKSKKFLLRVCVAIGRTWQGTLNGKNYSIICLFLCISQGSFLKMEAFESRMFNMSAPIVSPPLHLNIS